MLFNESVLAGLFPNCLKLARVIPIFKSGDTEQASNYRPISTLPVISKLFEKLMYRRFDSFLSKYKILTPCQFGFRSGRSTADAVLEFCDTIYNTVNLGGSVLSVFLDFSKAFDTVNHQILLSKLDHYGVRGLAHDWFRSYLSNRSQYVEVNCIRSEPTFMSHGVPQGSTLGPLLFLLYVNDMNNSSNVLQFVHFADDTTVSLPCESVGLGAGIMNSELSRVDAWLATNRLSLNIKKSSYMLFSATNLVPPFDIRVRDVLIDRV
jgi:hypothetical protein